MGGPDRNVVADAILEVIGSQELTCKQIAEPLGLDSKAVYGHLHYMAGTLGVVERCGRKCGSGGYVNLWRKRQQGIQPRAGAVITADWPRGQHKRDAWDVALFGDRRKPEPEVVVDPRQMDLLEGLD